MKTLVASVVLDGAIGSFDKEYSYAVPKFLEEKAKVGCRVTMPFGRSNLKKQGMIFALKEKENSDNLKDIYEVLDKEPILNHEMIELCRYMHDRVFCTYYDAVKAMLPAGLNYRLTSYYSLNEEFVSYGLLNDAEKEIYDFIRSNSEISEDKIKKNFSNSCDILSSLEEKLAVLKDFLPKRQVGDLTRKWLKCSEFNEGNFPKLTARQKEIYNLVFDFGEVSVREVQYFTGVTASVINNLVNKGVLLSYEKQEFRIPYRLNTIPQRTEIKLTDEQTKAFNGIITELNSKKSSVSLLYGVTGSGKTQVFLRLVDYVSDMGKGVIIMVPEIALTPQMIEIFSQRYGNKIAVFHSAMSQGQRMDEYKRVKQGKAKIAIGTRTAVFAPFTDLGLIIIDEEQEHTYKSEKSPRFHARDIAKFRIGYHKCSLCLASATPSIESYSLALSGKYKLFSLKNRYGNAILPEVTTVDMRKELADGNNGAISRELSEAINDTLKSGHQAIVLLNRRGHNTYVSCSTCTYVAACPNCSISMTYHSANGRLMCHYCGYSESKPLKCPECDGTIRFMGAGTQKVEEELSLIFPEARILRLDADSTVNRDSYSKYLSDFAEGKYDIMLGTQMVAKGLNFPNVTLVGVIGADQATYSEDFKSFERTFSLLTQVVGRAGRGDIAGRAVIQTISPDSSIISLACQQNYDEFYNEEIMTRKLYIYPPYCDICVVWCQSTVKEQAFSAINEIFTNIKDRINNEYNSIKLVILGPSPAAVPKINNRYRFKILIKCKNNSVFRDMLRKTLDIRLKGDTAVYIDINPETLI